MTIITIIYDGSIYTRRWLWTLIWAKEKFKNEGYKFKFYVLDNISNISKIRDNISYSSEIACLAFHDGIRNLPVQKKNIFFTNLRKKYKRIIWLDTSDSSGTCNFEVLPYVDKYLKKQLLVDVKSYTNQMYGCRPHSHYFHTHLGVNDENIASEKMNLLDMRYADKLGLSWNVGLGNIYSHGIKHNITNRFLFPHFKAKVNDYQYSNVFARRDIDVQFQGTITSPGVGWQRVKANDILAENNTISTTYMRKKGSFMSYLSEMANSKCTLGLFSYGEICYRDFETFISGALLIKPDMSHLNTFPNWFMEGETYVPIRWDLSDLESVLVFYLENENARLKIAKYAQDFYKKWLADYGKNMFVRHFLGQII